MRGFLAFVVCVLAALSGAFATASAQATSYTITGPSPLPAATQFVPPCGVGNCRNLTTAGVVGSFTVPAPLAPNAVTFLNTATNITITAGGMVISSGDPNFRIYFAGVLTDNSGAVVDYIVMVQKLARNTVGTGDTGVNNPNARLDEIDLRPGNNRYVANVYCTNRDVNGICQAWFADDSSSTSAGGGSSVFALGPAIPTLSEWALLALALALGGFAVLRIRRGEVTL